MKKGYWILIVIAVLVVVIFLIRGSEDSWIKDNKGEDAENTLSEIPDYISEQQTAIIQARQLYLQKRQQGMNFESQCLGIVGDKLKYAVDIVHVPRNSDDNKPENQCEDFRTGKVQHFIELDREGSIFRIV